MRRPVKVSKAEASKVTVAVAPVVKPDPRGVAQFAVVDPVVDPVVPDVVPLVVPAVVPLVVPEVVLPVAPVHTQPQPFQTGLVPAAHPPGVAVVAPVVPPVVAPTQPGA